MEGGIKPNVSTLGAEQVEFYARLNLINHKQKEGSWRLVPGPYHNGRQRVRSVPLIHTFCVGQIN